ncbi:hypothetical protein OAJ21_02665 [Pelagibacteraceae bacterium]|nr:hypothetical protein [Pelagibacteraceae bacterium]
MKIVVLIGSILFIFLLFKILSGRSKIKTNSKNQNETIIDLEKDPKTKEYKPKE